MAATFALLIAGCSNAGGARDSTDASDATWAAGDAMDAPPLSCRDAYSEIYALLVERAETNGRCAMDSDCTLHSPRVQFPVNDDGTGGGLFEYCNVSVSDVAGFEDATRELAEEHAWEGDCAIYADFRCPPDALPECIDSRSVYPRGCLRSEPRCIAGICRAQTVMSCAEAQARWRGLFEEIARDLSRECDVDDDCAAVSSFDASCGSGVMLEDQCLAVATTSVDDAQRRLETEFAEICGDAIAGPCSPAPAPCGPARCIENVCRTE
jgi:hypothetical protein